MGKANDMVALLVEHRGPAAALYHLEDSEACARKLADEARGRGQLHTAAGLDRAAERLRLDQFDLVARFG